MFNMRRILLFGALVALTLTGCSQGDGPLAPADYPFEAQFGYVLPDGATLTAATFKVYATGSSFQDVDVFTATRDWEELGVTWGNFNLYDGGAYDPVSHGGFTVDGGAMYYTVDVTAQVADWMSGAEANQGLLVKQILQFSPRTEYFSRERGESPPVLEITYLLDGASVTETLEALADAMINEVYPDQNFGATDKLFSGWRNEGEKVSLVIFDLDVTEPELAAIGDYVWYDTNMDGIQDEGELGVAGVVVHLMDCQGNTLGTDTTDADGYYWFGDLEPGDYNIHFVLPDGYVFSPQDMGGDDLLDSDADPSTGGTICTTLDPGEEDPSWDAGIYMPIPELAAIGDYVWYDTNMDGIQDEGELGVAGVVVHLMDCQGNTLGTTVTDADGWYWFGDLEPGDYNIHFVLPDGYVFSPQDMGGDDLLDSDADPSTGGTICTTLDPGEEDPSWDAGIYMPEDQEGCSHTIGYWKTHTGLGNGNQADEVTPLLGDGIWLGDEGGAKSLAVTDVYIAVDVLEQRTYGRPSNGITKLYAQLLGTKLSIADGASDTDVADAIADADAFLAEYDWNDWSDLSDEMADDVMMWHGMFDDYNNGDIGPGHCDEEGDDDDGFLPLDADDNIVD